MQSGVHTHTQGFHNGGCLSGTATNEYSNTKKLFPFVLAWLFNMNSYKDSTE